MDLHRLKTYINERVKESLRLEQWARANANHSLAHSHWWSAQVGKNILEEIENEERLNQSHSEKDPT